LEKDDNCVCRLLCFFLCGELTVKAHISHETSSPVPRVAFLGYLVDGDVTGTVYGTLKNVTGTLNLLRVLLRVLFICYGYCYGYSLSVTGTVTGTLYLLRVLFKTPACFYVYSRRIEISPACSYVYSRRIEISPACSYYVVKSQAPVRCWLCKCDLKSRSESRPALEGARTRFWSLKS
jgi:hypothetical protein